MVLENQNQGLPAAFRGPQNLNMSREPPPPLLPPPNSRLVGGIIGEPAGGSLICGARSAGCGTSLAGSGKPVLGTQHQNLCGRFWGTLCRMRREKPRSISCFMPCRDTGFYRPGDIWSELQKMMNSKQTKEAKANWKGITDEFRAAREQRSINVE